MLSSVYSSIEGIQPETRAKRLANGQPKGRSGLLSTRNMLLYHLPERWHSVSITLFSYTQGLENKCCQKKKAISSLQTLSSFSEHISKDIDVSVSWEEWWHHEDELIDYETSALWCSTSSEAPLKYTWTFVSRSSWESALWSTPYLLLGTRILNDTCSCVRSTRNLTISPQRTLFHKWFWALKPRALLIHISGLMN